MKIRMYHLLGIFTIFFFVFAESKENQKSKWKGKISEEEGVRIIKNPREPAYGELKFNLIEDLSIGKENDDRYLFYGIRDIKVDADENIYVFEVKNRRVQKFDRNGQFLCTIGRQGGQGPGEFQMPNLIILDDKNGVVGIQDLRVLKIFKKDGNYLNEDINFEIFNSQLIVDTDGNLWGIASESEGSDDTSSKLFKVLISYNAHGKIKKRVARFPYEIFQERKPGSLVTVTSGEEYSLFISTIGKQDLVYGYSKEYELNMVDSEGDLLLRIRKEEPYQNFSAKEKQKGGKGKFPEHKPFFYSILTDSQARIYAQRNNPDPSENLERRFDIFSRDGYYLYKTTCPLTPYVIKNGFFYTQVVNDETGEVFVKRFRIKNWGHIKDGI